MWLPCRLAAEEELAMRKISRSFLTTSLFFYSISAWAQANPCDLNNDGRVDASDVQAAINMSLGVTSCTANIAGSGVCNVIVVQRVINATAGSCLTSGGLHVVSLSWNASTSAVSSYRVYRATVASGTTGAFTLLYQTQSTTSIYQPTATSFLDNTVLSGASYVYVVRAVDSSGVESTDSNQATTGVITP
jgi:hypothetical protein